MNCMSELSRAPELFPPCASDSTISWISGITALELMPVADFPGRRNWGYDGVFPFAPDSSYGRPEDLKESSAKRSSARAHGFAGCRLQPLWAGRKLSQVIRTAVFYRSTLTPWGNGINFDGPESRAVRDFFINNALYWLTEYHFDGLRLDAVHAIADDSTPDILTELADTVRRRSSPIATSTSSWKTIATKPAIFNGASVASLRLTPLNGMMTSTTRCTY